MSKRYVVTAPYVTLVTETPEGRRLVGFYKDAPVPADVDQGVIDRHVEAGLIAEVPPSKSPEPAKSSSPAASGATSSPSGSSHAPKGSSSSSVAAPPPKTG